MHDVGNQQIFCNSYLLPLHGDIVTCSMPITATVSSPSINDNRRKWAINHWIIRSESLITYDREGGTVIVLVLVHSISTSIHFFFKLIHSNLSTLLLLQQTLILIAPKFSRERKEHNMENQNGSNSLKKVTFSSYTFLLLILEKNSSFFHNNLLELRVRSTFGCKIFWAAPFLTH